MQKNVVLIIAGAGTHFLGPQSKKTIKNKETLLTNLETLANRKNNKAVVNLTTSTDTLDGINVFKNVRKEALVKVTLHSDDILSNKNELLINTHEGEEHRLDGDYFDFVFRPKDYEIQICGIDLNGALKNTIESLLEKGYKVTVFSDAVRPFTNTAQYINSLSRNSKFQYCSYKVLRS